MDHAKVQGYNFLDKKRKNVILHYFGDYLKNSGSECLTKLQLDIFNKSNSMKISGSYTKKSTIGNISHLRNVLPKSNLMKIDLLDFTKN